MSYRSAIRTSGTCLLALALMSCSSDAPNETGQTEIETATPPMCDSTPNTQRLRVWPPPLQPIANRDGLWLDPLRGVVLDVSDAAAPRRRSGIDVVDLSEVTPLAERRLVAARAHVPQDVHNATSSAAPDELLVFGFDDPDAPEIVTRVAIPGEIALVTALEARVFVLSDEIERRCTGPSKQSYLYSFAFEDDALVQLDKLALGDDVQVAERRDDHLVLMDGTYLHVSREEREPSLRVISLQDDVPVVSERAKAPSAAMFQPQLALSLLDDTLTLVADASKASALHIMRYQLTNDAAPRVLSDCLSAALDSGGPAAMSALGDHIVVGAESKLIEISAACNTEREEDQTGLIDVPSAGVSIEAKLNDAHELEVSLRSATGPEIVATAKVAIPEELEVSLRDNVALTDVVAFEQGGTTERGLLGVATSRGPLDDWQLQLFSFSDSTITARGTLLGASRLAAPTTSGVAASHKQGEVFMTFELDSTVAARSPQSTIRLSPLD